MEANAESIPGPDGRMVTVPLSADAAPTYPDWNDGRALREYYDEHGYVVVRGLISTELCDVARAAFASQVKPYPGLLYRQATAELEAHRLTEHGYMLNSILNIQDLDRRRFSRFRDGGLALITHQRTQRVINALMGEPGKVVQTMYFEGNPATWAHQDTYYLDSAQIGRMVAAWFAVEDIHAGAGRFFVYPQSHKIDMVKNGGDFDIAFSHDRYKQLVIDIIRKHGLECRAPALRKGDVLLWSAKTIHGSLDTTHPEHSRASFTAHYIPESTEFLQWQSRIKPLRLKRVNGVLVHHPKDQSELRNRAIAYVEGSFPQAFRMAKRLATKIVTR
jgi:phytanoyl-CoA hydroxylase